MAFSVYHRTKYGLALCGATLACLGLGRFAQAETNTADPAQTTPTSGTTGVSASKLQVSGTPQLFNLEADHADVQSALKLIFDQANKQFDIDNSGTGAVTVTLRLTSQTLETTLTSLCHQAFLRYRRDPATGIYHFEQDTDAIKTSFTHLDDLNALLRQHLRELGLELPADGALDTTQSQNRSGSQGGRRSAPAPGNGLANPTVKGEAGSPGPVGPGGPGGPQSSARGGGGGGFGGGAGGTPVPGAADLKKADRANTGDFAKDKQNTDNKNPRYREGSIRTDFLPEDTVRMLLGADQTPQSDSSNGYLQFLRQNNFVSINTHGERVPFTDVLTEIGKQANRAVLIDPLIPRGPKFSISLTLPATSLEDALNCILPASHMRWRWLNNAIFIAPLPDFLVFYGNSTTPNVIYGLPYGGRGAQNNGLQNNGATGRGAPPQNGNGPQPGNGNDKNDPK